MVRSVIGEAGAVQPVDDRVAGEHLGGQAGEQEQELEFGDGDRHRGIVPMRLPGLADRGAGDCG